MKPRAIRIFLYIYAFVFIMDAAQAKVETPSDGHVTVERATQFLGRTGLIRALSQAMRDQGFGPEAGTTVEYEFDYGEPRIAISSQDPATIVIDQLTFDRRTRRFSAMVLASDNGIKSTETRIDGRLIPAIDTPAARRDLQPGTVIQPQDLELRSVRMDRINSSIISTIDQLIGRTVKRPIPAQQLIRISDITPTILVTKNHQIQVRLTSGSMILQLQGKALENGSEGDVIRILNPQSNRTIQGVVSGPDIVIIDAKNLYSAN